MDISIWGYEILMVRSYLFNSKKCIITDIELFVFPVNITFLLTKIYHFLKFDTAVLIMMKKTNFRSF